MKSAVHISMCVNKSNALGELVHETQEYYFRRPPSLQMVEVDVGEGQT